MTSSRKIKRIIVRGLTPETHGNAAGIGQAEFCSKRVVDEVNLEITKINCLTGGGPVGAMLPVSFETEREILDAAFGTIGLTPTPDTGVMWIEDTLHLAEVECSAKYLAEAKQRSDLEILTDLREIEFDAQGNLIEFGELTHA